MKTHNWSKCKEKVTIEFLSPNGKFTLSAFMSRLRECDGKVLGVRSWRGVLKDRAFWTWGAHCTWEHTAAVSVFTRASEDKAH